MGQITEVEQQEIEKKGKKLYPFNFNGMDNNTQEIRREFWINGAIAMAEKKNAEIIELKTKLEEKDKEIELLRQQAIFSNEIEKQLQTRIEQDIEKLESKDRELAQLKEIAERMVKILKTSDIEDEDEDEELEDVLMTYAEWCK